MCLTCWIDPEFLSPNEVDSEYKRIYPSGTRVRTEYKRIALQSHFDRENCGRDAEETKWKMDAPLPCDLCDKVVEELIWMLPTKEYDDDSNLLDVCEECNEEAIAAGIARPN